ncbi:MAG TPA: DUF4159 domain-containing protein [Candidatus Marinimicrobia bacterium]|nr:DUF4159 domain-containing protein [Candidatus Neomarinimicrobiota bacterium]MDP7217493.1 DUF4159 domain-containing protein [Candidatus Neomarinimicrobiota bacterium]HJM69673.1 DUF4159 domain-containing protein [Candidatus Neomarinimicrobiota bacterium]
MRLRQLTILVMLIATGYAQHFTIARLHYGGGGDWYSNPSSLPNLLNYLQTHTTIIAADKEARVKLTDENLFSYPYLYMTGHGNVRFTEAEIIRLRTFLQRGGFLHADDNYGMDQSFRREMKRVFPEKKFVELPHDHPVYSQVFDFKYGLPKVHEHDNKPPQALALFEDERIMILYTYECDLGDGWEDIEVHNDPQTLREAALQMGVNIIHFALTQ